MLDAVAMAHLVRTGEVSPSELVDDAIERLRHADAALNVLVSEQFAEARSRAAGPLPDGPFRGVPIVLKDLGGARAGDPYFCGMRLLRRIGHRADRDDHVTALLTAAGFVVLGRTATPELGLAVTTEPAAFGPTRNPWDPTRSTGGSSGGSAVAVATGAVPVGHANDGAGSIRVPAAYCGLVGLKPTRGRVSLGPDAGDEWGGLTTEGVVVRTVRDAAALLDVLGVPMLGDPHRAPAPDQPYLDTVRSGPSSPLRIGVLDAGACAPEVSAAVADAAALLADLGHRVAPGQPDGWLDDDLPAVVADVMAAAIAHTIQETVEWLGEPPHPDDLEPATLAIAEHGRTLSAVDVQRALATYNTYTRRVCAWWGDHDVLLAPVTAELAPPLGRFADSGGGIETLLRDAPFTVQANVAGLPAISVPLHWTADGLPVGVQLVGGFGREDVLLRLAAQLEAARPWAGRRPELEAAA